MLTHWKDSTWLALFWLAATGVAGAYAQVPTPIPNPYATPAAPGTMAAPPPAWGQPPTGFAPLPGDGSVPPVPPAGGGFAPPGGGGEEDGYYAPATPAPGFDYFDEEDDGSGGGAIGSGSGGGSRGPVKDSVKFVARPANEGCKHWGNSLLGPTKYSDRNSCEFELNQKVDRSSASIEDTYDQVELFKLKKVIHGDLESRAEANKYNVSFDALKKALTDASKKGCSCQN